MSVSVDWWQLLIVALLVVNVAMLGRRPRATPTAPKVVSREACSWCADHAEATAETARTVNLALATWRREHLRRWHPDVAVALDREVEHAGTSDVEAGDVADPRYGTSAP